MGRTGQEVDGPGMQLLGRIQDLVPRPFGPDLGCIASSDLHP